MHITPLTPEQLLARRFTTAVFAGGGNRCWWQGGLVEAISSMACWQVNHVVGVSAGAGIATAFVTGKLRESLDTASKRFDATPRNNEWRDLLRGKRPFMLPRILPDWVDSYLSANDFARLQASPIKVEVVVTRLIPYLPYRLSAVLALLLYTTEKYWLKGYHSRVPYGVGLRTESLDLRAARDVDHAKNWLLGSTACWPIAGIQDVDGRPALDGGFYDNVPLPKNRENDAATLVLLTRHRPELPQIFELDKRTYIQPTDPQVASSLDCTSGEKCRLTFEQGLADGQALLLA
jgi:predicted acylesterase/phospholipase RssA